MSAVQGPAAVLAVLQHAHGLDEHGRGQPYRNHFVTGRGCADHAACTAAVADGLMVRRDPTALTGGDDLFLVTPVGRKHVAEFSPPPPKRTRSQQRYQHYLDADSSLTFGEWLRRNPDPPQPRRLSAAELTRIDQEVPF